jgi:hypothetical protein
MSALSPSAEQFLRDLGRCLSALPEAERRDVVAEIRSHLLDRMDAGGDPVLQFGNPEEYAAAFLQERALAGALAGGSSWALGRALLTGVGKVTWWYVVAVLAMLHVYGACLVALAAFKPVFPANIGWFVGDRAAGGAVFGPDFVGAREVLGWWAVPFFLVPGVLMLWGANYTLRALGRWRYAALPRARTTG